MECEAPASLLISQETGRIIRSNAKRHRGAALQSQTEAPDKKKKTIIIMKDKSSLWYKDYAHFNEEGYRLLAENVSRIIREKLNHIGKP